MPAATEPAKSGPKAPFSGPVNITRRWKHGIKNSRGEILIQQRSVECEILPGAWGLTTGRMIAGESTQQGCIREIREELGLCVTPLKFNFKRIPRGELLWDIYLVQDDTPSERLQLQAAEVAQAKWVSPRTFRFLLETGKLFWYPEIEEILSMVERHTKTGQHKIG